MHLPACRGRHPHLRRYDEKCREKPRTMLLGASNNWFPITLSSLALPAGNGGDTEELERFVTLNWPTLSVLPTRDIMAAVLPNMVDFASYDPDIVWKAVERRKGAAGSPADGSDNDSDEPPDLKAPEWALFIKPRSAPRDEDFALEPVAPPHGYSHLFTEAVRVERLREVRALVGFTRIEPPGDIADGIAIDRAVVAPLARGAPSWVPAGEVRGEGLFLRFREDKVASWCIDDAVREREAELRRAHEAWRLRRKIDPDKVPFPGIRYILLHSFSHLLVRQLARESGYGTASIRERIYAREEGEQDGPMAGILFYASAPDSEGTMGGLVELGDPHRLGRHIEQALRGAALCASDPLCAEGDPDPDGSTRNGAACHACLHVPETSCERGNATYLDRTLLVETFGWRERPFFGDGAPLL